MADLLLPLPSEPQDTTPACLVMVDLVGSTRLARSLPLGHYMALMSEFIQLMILSFEVRGGQVLQHQGDAVLGYWPADQTDVACLAALEVHERAGRLNLAEMLGTVLEVRVGMAVGEVITGVVGGQLSAYGLPVNYAKRLCDSAEPGETRVSVLVAQLAAGRALLDACAPLNLPGFGAGCQAYRLRAPEQAQMKVD